MAKTELYLFIGGILVLMIVGWIIGWKLYEWRRKKWLNTLNNSKRKRWQRLEKARVSRGGYKKGFAIMACAMLIPWILLFAFHIPIPRLMLFFILLFIPLFIPHAWLVFKRKNKNEIILVIILLFMLICAGLWGMGYKYGLYLTQISFWIFIGWMWLKMKGEEEAMTIYSNLVVTTGLDMDSHLNGYSQRPFSKQSIEIKNNLKDLDFKKITDEFGKTMGKEMIFMNWKIENDKSIFYPVTANLLIAQIYTIFPVLNRNKDKISWIKINKEGDLVVFVSKGDYERILDPVTYHVLCGIIAEKFERAFVEFAKGGRNNKLNSIKILRGDGK